MKQNHGHFSLEAISKKLGQENAGKMKNEEKLAGSNFKPNILKKQKNHLFCELPAKFQLEILKINNK